MRLALTILALTAAQLTAQPSAAVFRRVFTGATTAQVSTAVPNQGQGVHVLSVFFPTASADVASFVIRIEASFENVTFFPISTDITTAKYNGTFAYALTRANGVYPYVRVRLVTPAALPITAHYSGGLYPIPNFQFVNDRFTSSEQSSNLVGDVTSIGNQTSVQAIAGQTAANVAAASLLANNATAANTANAIVKRGADGSVNVGPLVASTITGTFTVPTSQLTGILGAAQFPALTGDITTTAGNFATTLRNNGVSSGLYGGSGTLVQIAVNAKGLVTNISNVALEAPPPMLTGDITTDEYVATLANSGATPGTYGSPSFIPVIQVDAKGRIVAVSSVANAGGGGAGGGGDVFGANNLTTSGAIPFVSTSATLNDSPAELFWNNTTQRMGIGNNDPAFKLDVTGGVRAASLAIQATAAPIEQDQTIAAISGNATLQTNRSRGSIELVASGPLDTEANLVPASWSFRTESGGPVLNAERMRITSDGRIGVGTSTPDSLIHIMDQSIPSQRMRGLMVSQHNDGSQPAQFYGVKSRGTAAAPTTVQNGDDILNLNARAFGTSTIERAAIIATVDGTVSANTVPVSLRFFTTNDTGTFAERIRISPNGRLGLGTVNPQTRVDILEDNTGESGGPIWITRAAQDALPAVIRCGRIRGTAGTGASNFIDDELCSFRAAGYGTALNVRAAITAKVTAGSAGGDTLPTSWDFSTQDTNGASATRMRLRHDGNLGIGTTNPIARLHVVNESVPDSPNLRGIVIDQNSSNINSSIIYLRKSRGTAASPTAVMAGDNLGNVVSMGFGTQMDQRGNLTNTVTAPVVGNTVPTSWDFATQDTGGGTAARMRLFHNGNLGIGDLAPANRLSVVRAEPAAANLIGQLPGNYVAQFLNLTDGITEHGIFAGTRYVALESEVVSFGSTYQPAIGIYEAGVKRFFSMRSNGEFYFRPTNASTNALLPNGGITFWLSSNTSLQFRVRGNDGVIRTASLTLN